MTTDPQFANALSALELSISQAADICRLEVPDEIATLEDRCRNGDPFPLIGKLWPVLVIDEDDPDAEFFQGTPGDEDAPCLRLDDWQREDILHPYFDDSIGEICIKGATKPGKGMAVALATILWFRVWDPSKVILSSTSHEHAKKNIFGEVCKWWRQQQEINSGRVQKSSIEQDSQHYLIVSNPASREGFSGQHGPRTLFVFDEASHVESERVDDARKQAAKIVYLGNPRTYSGAFYNLWQPTGHSKNTTQTVNAEFGGRHCVTVGGEHCLNVKQKRLHRPMGPPGGIKIGDKFYDEGQRISKKDWLTVKPLIPEQLDFIRYMQICAHQDANHVAVFGHGHFPDEDPELMVIMPSWLQRHINAWEERRGGIVVNAFSFDVGASEDGDPSVLAAGSEEGVAALHDWQAPDVARHAHNICQIALEQYGINLKEGRHPVAVDKIGVGKGTADRLLEMGVWVLEFDAGARATTDTAYANMRAQAYGELGRRLSPVDIYRERPWCLPNDEKLVDDLVAQEKEHIGGDALRWKLVPKADIKSKIGRSPDRGDAVSMLWHVVQLVTDEPFDDAPILASGEDPAAERQLLSDAEVEQLPSLVRDIIQDMRSHPRDDDDEW